MPPGLGWNWPGGIGPGGPRPICGGPCPGKGGGIWDGGRITGAAGYDTGGAESCGMAGREICGCIIPGAGPPTPRTGPASPGCACTRGAAGTPRPAARPTPGPETAEAAADLARDSSGGGGPSTVMEMTSSPRRRTRPRVRRSSRSALDLEPLAGGSLRNSSQSPRTRFMWRSKAMNLPTSWRPSWMVTRIR